MNISERSFAYIMCSALGRRIAILSYYLNHGSGLRAVENCNKKSRPIFDIESARVYQTNHEPNFELEIVPCHWHLTIDTSL